MDWALAFAIGMGTSLVELLSRYRDEPLKVIATSQFAWIYLMLNGCMALGAHAVLLEREFVVVDTPTSLAGLAVISGLSAALILRARVFTAQLGDEQVSIGPGYVVDQLLNIVDAQIDRRRALQRVSIVIEVMEGKDFEGSQIHASTMIMGSRQNLSLQDQKDLGHQIREVTDRKISDQEKAYALGFLVLDFMGEAFLKAMAERLPNVEVPTVSGVSFNVAGITDTGAGVVSRRTWGASLPVQRAKVVREMLTGVGLELLRKRTLSLLDSGQLGSNEDERMVLRNEIAEILERDHDEADKVFALGFAVHALVDSTRFRAFYAELSPSEGRSEPEGEDAAEATNAKTETKTESSKPRSKRAREPEPDDSLELDLSISGITIDTEDSGLDRPKTGEHPAISLHAGPLPIAKDR